MQAGCAKLIALPYSSALIRNNGPRGCCMIREMLSVPDFINNLPIKFESGPIFLDKIWQLD